MPLTEMRESRAFVQEMKFLVSPEIADAIQQWSRKHLSPDPYAGGSEGDEYRVTSLYLDTVDYAVFDRRGSYGRTKYRVRRYGANERIYLERKLKTGSRVGKTRSVIPLIEVSLLDGKNASEQWTGQWFYERVCLRALRPVCQISYSRTARIGVCEGGPIRLTIDQDLRAVPVSAYKFSNSDDGVKLSPDQRIIELKYKLEMPGMFKQLMQEFNLHPQPSSKYRHAVMALELKSEALCLNS